MNGPTAQLINRLVARVSVSLGADTPGAVMNSRSRGMVPAADVPPSTSAASTPTEHHARGSLVGVDVLEVALPLSDLDPPTVDQRTCTDAPVRSGLSPEAQP